MRIAGVLLLLSCLLSSAGAQSREAGNQSQRASTPARIALERMSLAERENSRISVEFESFDSEAVALGHEVEQFWNGGQYDEALAQLRELEARAGHVAIGNSWRKPVPTIETRLWGRDVRIGNRDLIEDLACVADDSTGNLFAVLRRGSDPHYLVCMSDDTGATWLETFTWVGSPPTAVDAGTLGDHFYVMYNSPGENASQVRVRRFLCSDGQPDTFRSGKTWEVAGTLGADDTMREAAVVGDRENGMLYLISLVSDGRVRVSSAYLNGTSWTKWDALGSGASSGLDGADNRGSLSRCCFFSYYDESDTLRVYRFTYWGRCGFREGDFWGLGLCLSLSAGNGTPTSISACRDTIVCAFEDETASPHQVRYAVGYTEGDTWTVGTLSNVDTAAEFAAVTALGGGSLAAVYRQVDSTSGLQFRQRVDSSPWSGPVSVADNEPCPARPAIEYLGSGVYGLAYLSGSDRVAYFDWSDWPSSLAEPRRSEASCSTPQAAIVRGVLLLPKAASLLDAGGRKTLDLKVGANDVRTLAPGVYFVREAQAQTQAQAVRKVVIAR